MKKALLVAVCLLGVPAYASESNHIIGGNIGYGTQDFESDNGKEFGAGDSLSTDIYYRYMLNNHFGVEAGLMAGTGGIVSAISSIFSSVDNISYTGFRGAIYGQVPLSESNHLYAKVGMSANQLDYDITGFFSSDEVKSIESSGSDFYGAVGWGIRFQSGLGLNLEYQYVPIQELQVQSFNFGMSYRF